MKINIVIDRGQAYGQDSKEGKEAKEIFKSLIATEFPVGLMHAKPLCEPHILFFSGTVTDFVTAIGIKKQFLASGKTAQDKQAMNAKLRPIYEKSKEIL